MIQRRTILTGAAALLLATRHAAAQGGGVTVEEIRAQFNARPAGVRRMAQEGLKGHGLYTGAIDGAWGPGTAEAYHKLMASRRYRRHATTWTFPHDIQVIETLLFLNSDAYP